MDEIQPETDHLDGCVHINCLASNSNPSVTQTLDDMDWERSIWNAAFSGDIVRVRNMIEKSCDPRDTVNAQDNYGYSPLHYAARRGQVDICRLLLQNGAVINAQTRCGKSTPLHKAAAAGKGLTTRFLIESGADLKIQDVDGKTALHKMTENGHYNLTYILKEACPDLNDIRDFAGKRAINI